MYVCMYVCMHACMHVDINEHLYAPIYLRNVYTCIYLYTVYIFDINLYINIRITFLYSGRKL
jgi:hypothetical protein